MGRIIYHTTASLLGQIMSRAPISIDFLVIAMVAISIILSWSIFVLIRKKRYEAHKKVQLTLGTTLLIAIIIFEIDIRINGWVHLAKVSPYFDTYLFPILYFHIATASITIVLWLITSIQALRSIPSPPRPTARTRFHKRISRVAAAFMYGTAITGWAFYWMAFIA